MQRAEKEGPSICFSLRKLCVLGASAVKSFCVDLDLWFVRHPERITTVQRPIAIHCPAKINLYLDVFGKRQDGYHELRTVMQAIDLCDTIAIDELEESIVVSCDLPSLPVDARNLCWRAADAMRRHVRRRGGIRIALAKRIPVSAGLGGGSSDAAGVLRGLNEIWGCGLPPEELEGIGAGLGSDVPFFIRGGAALCAGRGERVIAIKDAPSYAYVLVTPPIAVPTAGVYAGLASAMSRPPLGEDDFLSAFASGDPVRLSGALYNRLEASVGPHTREVTRLKEALRRHGALGACMSGSGPSVFGIAMDGDAARLLAEKIRPELADGTFLHFGATAVVRS
jgi:4-diphosphocytidyl-2-C-methyl-D-erythritol kinase